MYWQNNATWSLLEYNKINERTLNKNDISTLDYLKWNAFYKQKKYKEAEEYFNKSLTTDNIELKFYIENWLWDTYYRIGENWNEQFKIDNREKSLENYKNAINEELNIEKKSTIDNYDYVKKKLDELKKKLEEEKQKNKDSDSWSWSSENQESWSWANSSNESWSWSDNWDKNETNKKDDNWDKEQIKNINGRNWTNGWSFNSIWDEENKNKKEMTPSEKRQLDNYSEELKEFQKYNQQYLQKWEKETQKDLFDKLMNEFSQDPFFREWMPDRNVEKDW